jgi:hypothetical protein
MVRFSTSLRSFFALGFALSAVTACSGGQTSIGAHDAALGGGPGGNAGAAGNAGSGGEPPACAWSGDSGLVAEWRANGNLDNEVPCSPLEAEIAGQVVYGPGREAQAWQIRSTWTSVDGGDPSFVNLKRTQDVALGHITVDAWLQQTGFNNYNNSNRLVFSTSYRPQPDMLPGEAQLYLHENMNYLAYIKTGVGAVRDDDWAGCDFPTLGPSEVLAPLDTWLRLTITYDGSMVRCYLNGVLESEAPLPSKEPPTIDLAPLIGRNFPGDVDALRVFNRALSDTEIAAAWP